MRRGAIIAIFATIAVAVSSFTVAPAIYLHLRNEAPPTSKHKPRTFRIGDYVASRPPHGWIESVQVIRALRKFDAYEDCFAAPERLDWEKIRSPVELQVCLSKILSNVPDNEAYPLLLFASNGFSQPNDSRDGAVERRPSFTIHAQCSDRNAACFPLNAEGDWFLFDSHHYSATAWYDDGRLRGVSVGYTYW